MPACSDVACELPDMRAQQVKIARPAQATRNAAIQWPKRNVQIQVAFVTPNFNGDPADWMGAKLVSQE